MAATKDRKRLALASRSTAPRRQSARPPVKLDALDSHLGYFVRRFQVWVFQDFISTLASIDIRPAQFSVLAVVGANRGLSQAELASSLGHRAGAACAPPAPARSAGPHPALTVLGRRPPPRLAAHAAGTNVAGARQGAGGAASNEIDRKARRRTSSDGARRVARFQMSMHSTRRAKPGARFAEAGQISSPAFFPPTPRCATACDRGRCAPTA